MVGGCCNTIAMGAYDGEWLGNADQNGCAGGNNLYVPIGLGELTPIAPMSSPLTVNGSPPAISTKPGTFITSSLI